MFSSLIERLRSTWLFLRDFLDRSDPVRTVIVMGSDWSKQSRMYTLKQPDIWVALAGYTTVIAVMASVLVTVTPLKLLFGFPSASERAERMVNAARLQAINDSLLVQEEYLGMLQALITGEDLAGLLSAGTGDVIDVSATQQPETFGSGDWIDHEQPAISLDVMPVATDPPGFAVTDGSQYLSSLRLPTLAPVGGVLTRAFDARAGHYGIDVATPAGTPVRAIGGGYVIMADWTHTGGHVIAIQHAGGHVSVYKHNSRLLKRVGDRVQRRDAIAFSGGSGDYSSGPHLHFELWQDGLAQDPGSFLLDL